MNRLLLIALGISLVATLSSYQRNFQEKHSIQRVEQEEVFPFPDIPSVITDSKARAAYLLTHYWDKVDFTRHVLSDRDALMEQGFVDFLSVFPHAESSVLQVAVHNLLKHALVDPSRVVPLIKLAENYLYYPNSPMLDEAYYGLFLEEFLQLKELSLADREKMKFHMSAISKNRVGTRAADIVFTDHKNKLAHLYDVKANSTLLFFYDADCEECKQVLSQMEDNRTLERLSQSGLVKVVTLCIEGSDSMREKISGKFPSSWIKGNVEEMSSLYRTYVLRAMPTLYLLDDDKNVVLKDISWDKLLNYWNNQ